MRSVSVAMATYNGAQFINEQLDSIVNQDHLPSELVITDDLSSDRTVSIIEEFASKSPFRVKVVKNDRRLGYRENFLKCASECSSELIAFCDQDDIWLPNKLSVQVRHFDDQDVLLSIHNYRLFGSQIGSGSATNCVFRQEGAYSARELHPLALYEGFTFVFRNQFFQLYDLAKIMRDVNHVNSRIAHDEFIFFVSLTLGKIYFTNQTLALYRQHEKNASGQRARSPNRSILSSISEHNRRSQVSCLNRLNVAAASRVLFLERILSDSSRFQSSAQYNSVKSMLVLYRCFSELSRLRLASLCGSSLAQRCIGLLQSLSRGVYKINNKWAFSYLGFAKDLCFIISGKRATITHANQL